MYGIQVSAFGSEDVLAYVELPDPRPAEGQVLVRMHGVGVNPADTYIRSGAYAFYTPELPYTPGFDGAGVVAATGAGVSSVRPGDRVFVAALGTAGASGAYAELAVVAESAVHPLPDSLSYQQGAAIGVPAVTAWRVLFQKALLRKGETVLIHGASGGVGIVATQLAHDAGAVVIGTAGSAQGAELVRVAGADRVLDHGTPGYLDVVREEFGGVAVVIEMLANVNLEADLGILADRGRVVVVGSRGSLSFTPRLAMIKEATVLGTALWNSTARENADALAGLAGKLASGVLRPVVGTELPLRDAAEAHRQVLAAGVRGKIVLIPD
jgi:NADPH2:quinone reductase